MVTLKRKVGSSQVEVQAQSMKEICSADDLLGRLPDKCGICGGTDLHFYHKTPKGFDYYGIRCRNPKCGAEQAFHTKQADGSFFIKWDDKFEKYDGSKSQEAKPPSDGPENFQDDVPF